MNNEERITYEELFDLIDASFETTIGGACKRCGNGSRKAHTKTCPVPSARAASRALRMAMCRSRSLEERIASLEEAVAGLDSRTTGLRVFGGKC